MHDVAVPPHSRFSLFANKVVPNRAFSTWINSTVAETFAERSMYVGYDGDVVMGLPLRNLWLFAEGATVSPFHTWLLLQNPNIIPIHPTITYLLENGQTVKQKVSLLPYSRSSIFVNEVIPNAAFSIRVEEPTFDFVAERAMYRFPGNSATVNSGVNAPSRSWFFADGRTSLRGLRADTFLLLQNPNPNPVDTAITLFDTNGKPTTLTARLQPTSRYTVFLNQFIEGWFGIRVDADSGIIVERSVFLGNEPLGSYSTQGATEMSSRWNLVEGETRAPFDDLISILNPHGQTMGVHIDFQLETGQVIGRDFTARPSSKLEIAVDAILTGANSARITTSLPSVVERTMFMFKQGSIGATNTIGLPQPQADRSNGLKETNYSLGRWPFPVNQSLWKRW